MKDALACHLSSFIHFMDFLQLIAQSVQRRTLGFMKGRMMHVCHHLFAALLNTRKLQREKKKVCLKRVCVYVPFAARAMLATCLIS